MTNRRVLFVLGIFLATVAMGAERKFVYVSPEPGAMALAKETNIVLRAAGTIDAASVGALSLQVSGSKSGSHSGTLRLSDDGRTLLFAPGSAFANDETVTVKLATPVSDRGGNVYAPFSFQFTTKTRQDEVRVMPEFMQEGFLNAATQTTAPVIRQPLSKTSGMYSPLSDTLVDVTVSDNPSAGYIFVSNMTFAGGPLNNPSLLIIDNTGAIVFERDLAGPGLDFKRQPNGWYTFWDGNIGYYVVMNSSFQPVDSIHCGGGYSTDEHELQWLPNGHWLLMSYDPRTVRMDTVVPGGQPTATVVGLIVQELDQAKNVVFQWRSWDHIPITDSNQNLQAAYIDYVHGNALDLDTDGNILLSSRHLSEVTKIDRETGAMLWRWGGKQNQFTFINDTLHFNFQHAVRRIASGNITIFDNGNAHTPSQTRALEYSVDEEARTARLVWSYTQPGVVSPAMGYIQRLDNGNSLIGWGATNPTVTEVTPNGTKAFEMTFPVNVYSYRAFRFDVTLTGVGNRQSSVPAKYQLSQNYPNPFNPSTVIQYALPAVSQVSLAVFNVIGQQVATLVNEQQSAGTHSVTFSAARMASGVYFYRLQARPLNTGAGQSADFVSTKKLVLLK